MKTYKSFSVYDEDDFFEKYNQKRNKGKSPNELIEQFIIDELIGEVKGKEILDLGCGDGKYGVNLLKRGAKHYHGIEGSKKMSDLANQFLKGDHSTLEIGDIEKTDFGELKYDLIISRLVLHYIEDLGSLLKRIKKSLKADGKFVFSVEHPVITSCYEAHHQKFRRNNWIVDNYFDSGERINQWMGKYVIKYHKTIEEYWRIINDSGLMVADLRESKPQESNFENQEEFKRRKRIPLFLMFSLKKK